MFSAARLQEIIDTKTKPLGALGLLEEIAFKIGVIQETYTPKLSKPHIVVFAGDHGIASEGVSAYPAEVTPQMVLNFVGGGAAINVFCRQHNIELTVVDAGVNFDFDASIAIEHRKVGHGTKNFFKEDAMSLQEVEKAMAEGRTIVDQIATKGTNCVGFGEMGIGNTSAASMLMHRLYDIPLAVCVGRGTGVDDAALVHKLSVLQKASDRVVEDKTPLELLAAFGGFEIAMMVGAYLQAAEGEMVILVDGFIATAAFAVAAEMDETILKYAVFCHQSNESGHKLLLDKLGATGILDIGMRLGEGSGCAVAYPLVQSAVAFLNEMSSFEAAGVSNKSE